MARALLTATQRREARTKSYADLKHLEDELKLARQSIEFYHGRLRVLQQAIRMKSRRRASVEA